MRIDEELQKVSEAFGLHHATAEVLGNGLIHQTYKVCTAEKCIVLQQINTSIFKNPAVLIHNYKIVFEEMNVHPIPAMVANVDGGFLWVDENNQYWRGTEYMTGTYSPSVIKNEQQAFTTANAFALFTQNLKNIVPEKLQPAIKDFHNLGWRYLQFETALENAKEDRTEKAAGIIANIFERKHLVRFYERLSNNIRFTKRILHHDCKISNILFADKDDSVVCVVDLDTVMPGYFFSDLGDMIRTIAGMENEESTEWKNIDIDARLYEAVLNGYLSGLELTQIENENIHHAGLLMIYMQAMRFVTDYLRGDIYYGIKHPGHNYNRAHNQIILLQRLEKFLLKNYNYNCRK